jgi:hypothetical protein
MTPGMKWQPSNRSQVCVISGCLLLQTCITCKPQGSCDPSVPALRGPYAGDGPFPQWQAQQLWVLLPPVDVFPSLKPGGWPEPQDLGGGASVLF